MTHLFQKKSLCSRVKKKLLKPLNLIKMPDLNLSRAKMKLQDSLEMDPTPHQLANQHWELLH